MSEGALLLPRSLIDELAEERAREIVANRRAHDVGPPIVYHQRTNFGLVGLGRQPSKETLIGETVGWAAIAARVKADRLASLMPKVYTRTRTPEGGFDRLEAPEHPAQIVIDNPGPVFSWRLLMRLLSFHLDQMGEGYFQILRDGLGIPRQLWPLPPQYTEPISTRDEPVSGYRVRTQGQEVYLDRMDVIRIWNPDPETLFTSMGSLGPQRIEWDADRFRLETIRTHFADGATPRTALKATAEAPPPNKDQKDAFAADWQQRYHTRLGINKTLPAFLPPGFDVVQLDQFGGIGDTVELGGGFAEQFLAAYGVPGSMVGMVVDVNRAAAETNQYTFDRNTMLPRTELVAEALNVQWIFPSYGDDVFAAFPAFVADDKEFDLRQEAQDLATKTRVVNEVRAGRGIAPNDYGDEPIGTIADEPYRPDAMFDEDPRDLRWAGEWPERQRARVPRVGPAAGSDRVVALESSELAREESEARMIWERNLAAEKRFTAKLSRALAGVWEIQRRSVLDKLATLLAKGSDPLEVLTRVTSEQVFRPLDWVILYERRVTPLMRQITGEAAAAGFADLIPGGEFSLTDSMVDAIEEGASVWQFQVDDATQRSIEQKLSQGIAEGDGVDAIGRRLDVVFKNRKRSRTVARTEVGKANQQGQLLGYETSGRATGKRWNTSLDGKVRPSHRIDGQEVAINESFTLADGASAAHPLDPGLSAANLVNCRCFMTPVKATA